MLPSNTNNTSPCTPVSSNCVIWQGPDISCINLCNGDTVSDVVAKLATELCSIIDATCQCNPDLTGLDISCMTAETPDGLVATLQEIIDYACNISNGGVKIEEPFQLPKCLQYRTDQEGLVTELPGPKWAIYVGNKICDGITALQTLNQNIKLLEERISTLEKCVLPCKPQQEADFLVVSSCLFKGREVTISQLLLALEQKFCSQTAATGDTAVISSTIGSFPFNGADKEVSDSSVTYGSAAGWVANAKSLAEVTKNSFIVLNDVRRAVQTLQQALPIGCEAADFKFTYNTIDSSGNGIVDQINLNFQGTKIPAGFEDCNGTTVVTVTDSDGSSITQNINVSGLINSSSGVNINVQKLNRFSSLNVSIPFCAGDGSSQCKDRQQVIIPLSVPCPTSVNLVPLTDSFQVNFTNSLGSDVSYTIEAVAQSTGVTLGKTTINNPGTSVIYTFPGATPGETYDVTITIYAGRNALTTCPTQTVTIPGVICKDRTTNTIEISRISDYTGLVYLGLWDNGVTVSRAWYDKLREEGNGKIVVESMGATVPCDSPILTNPTMDYLAVPGDVAVTISYGTEPAPTSVVISYSIDGINYLGATDGEDGLRTISTGATSGSVYIKAQTVCTGPEYSIPTIIRYDFATEVWVTLQSPQECANTSLTQACPAGVEVSRQYLECGATTYAVFGGNDDSYWFYVGKTINDGVTKYLYAGWDNATNAPMTMVECCICPTFILSDPIQAVCGANGDSIDITLPYVLGGGEPLMTVTVNPVIGTVSQGTQANIFTYTSASPARDDYYADTFQVSLQPSVPGTDGCSLATITVQVQTLNCNTVLEHTDSDIYVFVNTNNLSLDEGQKLKNGFGAVKSGWNGEFGWTGNPYFIPTDDKRYLTYLKAIVDDGASWSQSSIIGYQALETLPNSWPGGSGVGVYKNSAMVIIFTNDVSGVYGDSTLAAGYGSGLTAQPTSYYKEDYDALQDMLKGEQSSTWALNLGLTQPQFPNGLSVIICPFVVNGSGGVDAAATLQILSAYVAENISASKYGIKTATDLTSYLLSGIAPAMPYKGATTGNNTITRLYKQNGFGMSAFLDQEYSNATFDEFEAGGGQVYDLLTRSIKGCGNTYPSTTIPALSVYEVEDCATSDVYFVTITDQSCGTIANGSVIKLNNPGATFSPGDGRADWTTLTNKCVTILDNCSGIASELGTDLDSRYDVCLSCTP